MYGKDTISKAGASAKGANHDITVKTWINAWLWIIRFRLEKEGAFVVKVYHLEVNPHAKTH